MCDEDGHKQGVMDSLSRDELARTQTDTEQDLALDGRDKEESAVQHAQDDYDSVAPTPPLGDNLGNSNGNEVFVFGSNAHDHEFDPWASKSGSQPPSKPLNSEKNNESMFDISSPEGRGSNGDPKSDDKFALQQIGSKRPDVQHIVPKSLQKGLPLNTIWP